MNKKILLTTVFIAILVFSFNCVFATNMVNDAQNTMNDSMNKTGNAVRDAGNGVMNAVNGVVDGTKNAVNELTDDRNTDNNNNNTAMTGSTTNNSNYTTTRTANDGTMLGMSATTWTWLIMGIVGIAIVALVWYYSMQNDTANRNYED